MASALQKLSDKELDMLEKGHAPSDLSRFSDAELDEIESVLAESNQQEDDEGSSWSDIGKSLALGAAQGATFSFADELASAVLTAQQILTGKADGPIDEVYEKIRDLTVRPEFDRLYEDSPILANGAELLLGMISPGPGKLMRSAPGVARAAVEGALGAAGSSESENAAELALDAGSGAALSGGLSLAPRAAGAVGKGLGKVKSTLFGVGGEFGEGFRVGRREAKFGRKILTKGGLEGAAEEMRREAVRAQKDLNESLSEIIKKKGSEKGRIISEMDRMIDVPEANIGAVFDTATEMINETFAGTPQKLQEKNKVLKEIASMREMLLTRALARTHGERSARGMVRDIKSDFEKKSKEILDKARREQEKDLREKSITMGEARERMQFIQDGLDSERYLSFQKIKYKPSDLDKLKQDLQTRLGYDKIKSDKFGEILVPPRDGIRYDDIKRRFQSIEHGVRNLLNREADKINLPLKQANEEYSKISDLYSKRPDVAKIVSMETPESFNKRILETQEWMDEAQRLSDLDPAIMESVKRAKVAAEKATETRAVLGGLGPRGSTGISMRTGIMGQVPGILDRASTGLGAAAGGVAAKLDPITGRVGQAARAVDPFFTKFGTGFSAVDVVAHWDRLSALMGRQMGTDTPTFQNIERAVSSNDLAQLEKMAPIINESLGIFPSARSTDGALRSAMPHSFDKDKVVIRDDFDKIRMSGDVLNDMKAGKLNIFDATEALDTMFRDSTVKRNLFQEPPQQQMIESEPIDIYGEAGRYLEATKNQNNAPAGNSEDLWDQKN